MQAPISHTNRPIFLVGELPPAAADSEAAWFGKSEDLRHAHIIASLPARILAGAARESTRIHNAAVALKVVLKPGSRTSGAYLIVSFSPVESTIMVVCIDPPRLLPSFESAAPSTVILSPILTVSFFQPPRIKA